MAGPESVKCEEYVQPYEGVRKAEGGTEEDLGQSKAMRIEYPDIIASYENNT